MKKIYYLFLMFIAFFSLLFFYDISNYYYHYNLLIEYVDITKKSIAQNCGIEQELKEYLLKNNIYITYEESYKARGEYFDFTIYNKFKYVLNSKEKIIKISLVVITGY